MLAGLEDGSLRLWDVRAGQLQQSVERAHATRVRGLLALQVAAGSVHHLASAASDGVVKLWDTRMLATKGAARCVAGGGHERRGGPVRGTGIL